MESLKRALIEYGPFAALAVLFALLLSFMDVAYPHPSQAASLQLRSLVPVLFLGLVGAWLLNLSGVTRPRSDEQARSERMLIPAALGIGFGLVAVLLDWMFGISATVARAMGIERIHLDAPYSILAYTVGAVVIESMFRLLPLGFTSAAVSKGLLKGKHLTVVFALSALVFAALEPLSQVALLKSEPMTLIVVALLVYAYGLVSSWQLWKYGVAAPLVMRLAFYGAWHVTLGPLLAGM